jgi:UDP-N-acetylmuramyl-tripeptide synthetase
MKDVAATVINLDDPFGAELLAGQAGGRRVIGYALGESKEVPPGIDVVRGMDLQVSRDGIRLRVATEDIVVPLQSHLLGGFNAQNLLAAFATLLALGLSAAEAASALQGAGGVRGRMEAVDASAGMPLVIVDYAHTPDGLRQVLASAREFCDDQLWCVFGCGGNRDSGKRPLMGAIAAELADRIVVTSDNPRDEDPRAIIASIVDGMPTPAQQQALVEPDRGAAVALAVTHAGPGDVVVIAGKGHETCQEVRGRRLPMSDHALVRAALRERRT